MEYSLLTVMEVTNVPSGVVSESVTVVVTTVLLCSWTEMTSELLSVAGVLSLVTVVVVVTVEMAQFSVDETTVVFSSLAAPVSAT